MTKQEIIDFINKNQVCALATTDGLRPYLRQMMTFRADNDGIIFHTGDFKDVYKQLLSNPNVELCFNADNMQLRVSGTAVLLDDIILKDEIIVKRKFLNSIIEKYGYESIKVFRVRTMSATVWTMATNLSGKTYIDLN